MTKVQMPGTRTTTDDPAYRPFLRHVADTFAAMTASATALFSVNTDGLWDAYLIGFSEAERQTYNCSACRQFIERFGGVVRIEESGERTPVCWDAVPAPDAFVGVIENMRKAVARRPVERLFLSATPELGTAQTGDWHHIAVALSERRVYRDRLRTPGQAAAAVRENVATVERALEEFSPEALGEALRILQLDALSRAEKFVGPVRWLLDLHTRRAETKDERRQSAILWQAVATAPEGYSHPRSSVIGPLLEGIAAGKSFERLRDEFMDMLHPLRYQRPQAAPSAGNIANAERVVATLGIERSLERRFARLDECETVWTPARKADEKSDTGGVFAHLTPKDSEPASSGLQLPRQTMTWEKFVRTVLQSAHSIDFYVPGVGNFTALVTATNADAPPIIRWDREDRRNPVTSYVYHYGSPASNWGLMANRWTRVTGIVPYPNLWGDRPSPQHGIGAVLVLDGAVDSRDSGIALFPETLRDDLHAIRATIEAFSNKGVLTGREQASACGFGIGKQKVDCLLRVTAAGSTTEYRIDRWD